MCWGSPPPIDEGYAQTREDSNTTMVTSDRLQGYLKACFLRSFVAQLFASKVGGLQGVFMRATGHLCDLRIRMRIAGSLGGEDTWKAWRMEGVMHAARR